MNLFYVYPEMVRTLFKLFLITMAIIAFVVIPTIVCIVSYFY